MEKIEKKIVHWDKSGPDLDHRAVYLSRKGTLIKGQLERLSNSYQRRQL